MTAMMPSQCLSRVGVRPASPAHGVTLDVPDFLTGVLVTTQATLSSSPLGSQMTRYSASSDYQLSAAE
jgi:hypothetical protein